jgi:hypothetical protein
MALGAPCADKKEKKIPHIKGNSEWGFWISLYMRKILFSFLSV